MGKAFKDKFGAFFCVKSRTEYEWIENKAIYVYLLVYQHTIQKCMNRYAFHRGGVGEEKKYKEDLIGPGCDKH